MVELRHKRPRKMVPPYEPGEFSKMNQPTEAQWSDLEVRTMKLPIATKISDFYRYDWPIPYAAVDGLCLVPNPRDQKRRARFERRRAS